MNTNDTPQVSPDPGDVQAVAELRVAERLGRPMSVAQMLRALEAYRRACTAEAQRQQAAIVKQLDREVEAYRRRHRDEVAR